MAWAQPDDFEICHLNDITACESVGYLIKYDSVHGTWRPSVTVEGNNVIITEGERSLTIPYSKCETLTEGSNVIMREGERSLTVPDSKCETLTELDYTGLGITMVLECTGTFLDRKALAPYFEKGIKKVVVSAPVKDADPVLNIVIGCNDNLYNPEVDHIVTAASCTTNCLAPVVKVIHEQLGIERGCITTIHNLTNTQTLVDAPNNKKSDLRRARSGLVNLAPTSTGSATAIALIFPDLKGKLNGLAVRVPLTNASITDMVFNVKKETTSEEVNELLKTASETYLKGILGYEVLPLVSTDYVNDARSSIVDAACTQVIDKCMVKIYAWYDNEYGYSQRLVDLAAIVASKM
eukprot:gene7409-537_t